MINHDASSIAVKSNKLNSIKSIPRTDLTRCLFSASDLGDLGDDYKGHYKVW